jgi:hypothetical protein
VGFRLTSSGLNSKSSKKNGDIVEGLCYNNQNKKQGFYGFSSGRAGAKKGRGQKIESSKQEAKWQSKSRNNGKESIRKKTLGPPQE